MHESDKGGTKVRHVPTTVHICLDSELTVLHKRDKRGGRVSHVRSTVHIYCDMCKLSYTYVLTWTNYYTRTWQGGYQGESCPTLVNESCHAECVTLQMCACLAPRSRWSCHKKWKRVWAPDEERVYECEWVTSHMRVTHMKESCHMYECVSCECIVSHMWMSQVAHMKEPYPTRKGAFVVSKTPELSHMSESCLL